MVISAMGSAPDRSMAALTAYMQQTLEQYPTPRLASREPAHWT
jgi:hypothetical protein